MEETRNEILVNYSPATSYQLLCREVRLPIITLWKGSYAYGMLYKSNEKEIHIVKLIGGQSPMLL